MREIINKERIELATPRLMDIPPSQWNIEREREIKERLKKEKKREITLCCKSTIDVIQKFLDSGITKAELSILIDSLMKHPLDRFSRNKYKIDGIIKVDTKKLVDEIFQISELFELKEHSNMFIEELGKLVQEQNTNSHWAATLIKFNQDYKKKIIKMKGAKKEVFVTYSWDSEPHKNKVLSFADFLRKNGFETDIDRKISQESTAADFTKMMHQAMTDYSKVIVVLSKGYKTKADSFTGGVGTEYGLIIKDIEENSSKYILVTLEGMSENITPLNFKGREIVDLSNKENLDVLFAKLQDVAVVEFSPVSANKPQVESKSIDKFEDLMYEKSEVKKESATQITTDIEILEIKTKRLSGGLKTAGKYKHTYHSVLISYKNNTSNLIATHAVELKINKDLGVYDPEIRTANDEKIYSKSINEPLYPQKVEEIELGHLIVSTQNADLAFSEDLVVTIYGGNNVSTGSVKLNEVLIVSGYPDYTQKIKLKRSDYH